MRIGRLVYLTKASPIRVVRVTETIQQRSNQLRFSRLGARPAMTRPTPCSSRDWCGSTRADVSLSTDLARWPA
eukprot:6186815-Pleurochrysis_carterae.AAC.1